MFAWRLLLNRLPTRDDLLRRHVLPIDEQLCTEGCGNNEDRNHLFVSCDFFGSIWFMICGWLQISSASSRNLIADLNQLCGLGGFSKNM